MSDFENMIKELCPNGVEFKRIDELFDSFSGMTGVSDKWKETGNCVFIDYLNVYNNMNVDITKLQNATVQKLEQNTLKKGDILLTSASETPEECAISSVIRDDIQDDVFLDDHLFAIRIKDDYLEEVNTAFVNYYMHTEPFRVQVCKKVRGVTRFYITGKPFMTLQIPVPPIKIQNKIVEILDNFTTLEAELEAELDCRKRQYEYYRNKLLTFNKLVGGGTRQISWIAMSDLGYFYGGLSGKSKNDFDKGDAKYITYMNVYSNISVKLDSAEAVNVSSDEKQNTIQYGDILFTGSSETRDECGMTAVVTDLVKEPIYLNSFCFGFRMNDNSLFNVHFLKHLFRGQALRDQIIKTASGVTRFNVSKKKMLKVIIPIPPIEEQGKIADILDRFEALTNDLQSGLPAEIEARRKQYEYYREKLLTFERKAA